MAGMNEAVSATITKPAHDALVEMSKTRRNNNKSLVVEEGIMLLFEKFKKDNAKNRKKENIISGRANNRGRCARP